MTQNTSSARELVLLLRKRLGDDRFILPGFSLQLDDKSCTDASVEVRQGYLRTFTVNGVRAEDLTIDLSDYDTNTLGKLVTFINAQPGYCAVPDRLLDTDHPAIDIASKPFGDLKAPGGVEFKHRRWSDEELEELLRQGIERHNVSYELSTVPCNEFQFVLNLSHANALRVLATNAVKRAGLNATVSDLIALAESYETAYRDDRKRQDRAIPVPTIRDDDVGEGDVVQGEMYRRSGRTGFVSPMAANLPPEPPVLLEPFDQDVGDTVIRVRWKRPRDYDFYALEVWRDTKEDVRRTRTGIFARNPTAISRGEQFAPTTSKLVFQTFGANSNFDTVGFATFLEEFGQLITSFIDGGDNVDVAATVGGGPLEPETTYYYRVYVVDLNYEIIDSNTVRATTKRLRARADLQTPVTPALGPLAGGTLVTLKGERFHEGMRVRLGDKFVTGLTIVSPTEATFLTPQFQNDRLVNRSLDLVIFSDTGLEDVNSLVWKVTA